MEKSLINWINSFHLSKKVTGLSDLTDGLMLNEICCQIAPNYFKSTGLRNEEEIEDNWVLKSENIKTLLNGIDSFFKDIGISRAVDSVDVDEISSNGSKKEIVGLIELVLGVLLECEHNSDYFQNIMDLDNESQEDLMVILENIKSIHSHQLARNSRSMSFSEPLNLNNSNNSNISNSNNNNNNNNEELLNLINQLKKEKSDLQNSLDDAKSELSHTLEERNKLSDEKIKIQEVCHDLQGSFESLQKQFDEAKLQSSMNVMTDEKIKEDINTLHVQNENKEKQLQEQKKRIDELTKQANENRSLRDEIDILKEKAVAAEINEKKLKVYEKKIEEVADLKKKIRELEEQNQNYLSQTLDLEEELSKSSSLKTQVESSKHTVSSLKIDNTKLELSLKSMTEERDKLVTQVSQHDLEKESLVSQISSLRSNITHIQQENESKLLELQSSMSMDGGLGEQLMDPVANEKIIRLERENKKLKETRIPELEKEVEELSNKLKEVQVSTTTVQTPSNDELESLKSQLQQANSTVDDLRKEIVEMYNKHKEETDKLNSESEKQQEQSSDTINKELKAENEKLQGYLRAAKDMIKKLRERLKDNQSNELQISEKDDYILKLQLTLKQKTDLSEQLYKQLKEAKEESSKELNLVLSTFYKSGTDLMDRFQHSKGQTSFLNKNRDSK